MKEDKLIDIAAKKKKRKKEKEMKHFSVVVGD